jgi:hypothetical protein
MQDLYRRKTRQRTTWFYTGFLCKSHAGSGASKFPDVLMLFVVGCLTLSNFFTTVPVGEDRQKIILKLNAEILGILFFSKKNLTLGEKIIWEIF